MRINKNNFEWTTILLLTKYKRVLNYYQIQHFNRSARGSITLIHSSIHIKYNE